MTLSMRSRRRRRGFTLIEVLLVLAILVIIGSLAVTNYFAVHNQAKIDKARLQISAFKNPLQLYRLQTGYFPQMLDALMQPMQTPEGRITGGSYIDSVPPDPWGMPYLYEYPSRHGRDLPDIGSSGPDGTPNTEDDIWNWQE